MSISYNAIFVLYSGLRLMLNPWMGQGFGYDLKKFIYILETGDIKKAEAEVVYSKY